MNQCPLLVAWAVLVLIKSHSNRHSEFWLLNWLILRTMGTRNCTLRLPPAVSPWTFFHWPAHALDTDACNCGMSCHTPAILVHHVLFQNLYNEISCLKRFYLHWLRAFFWVKGVCFLLHSNSIIFHVQMSGLSTLSCPLIVFLLPLQIELRL